MTPHGPYAGVVDVARPGRWRAVIEIDGRRINLGTFNDPRYAASAYDGAAYSAWGERAVLNFPMLNKLSIVAKGGQIARHLRERLDATTQDAERRCQLYAAEAKRLQASASAMVNVGDLGLIYREAADVMAAWSGTLLPALTSGGR